MGSGMVRRTAGVYKRVPRRLLYILEGGPLEGDRPT